MRRLERLVIPAWMLPLLVIVLVVPAAAGFAVAGPPLGLAIGAITVAALLFAAARIRYDEPIEVAASTDRRYRMLVVATEPVAEPQLVERIAAIAAEGQRAVDPARPIGDRSSSRPRCRSRLDRWASDVRSARRGARQVLAVFARRVRRCGYRCGGQGRRRQSGSGRRGRAPRIPGTRGRRRSTGRGWAPARWPSSAVASTGRCASWTRSSPFDRWDSLSAGMEAGRLSMRVSERRGGDARARNRVGTRGGGRHLHRVPRRVRSVSAARPPPSASATSTRTATRTWR